MHFATEMASYHATDVILRKYVAKITNPQNYIKEEIKTFFAQIKNALATIQNDKARKLTIADMFEKTPVGTYGVLAKAWPDILAEATGEVVAAEDDDEEVIGAEAPTPAPDAKKKVATAGELELAGQLQKRDIVETGTPNGALQAVMDFIQEYLPK